MQRIVKNDSKWILLTALYGTVSNWQNNALWYVSGTYDTLDEAKRSSYSQLVGEYR